VSSLRDAFIVFALDPSASSAGLNCFTALRLGSRQQNADLSHPPDRHGSRCAVSTISSLGEVTVAEVHIRNLKRDGSGRRIKVPTTSQSSKRSFLSGSYGAEQHSFWPDGT